MKRLLLFIAIICAGLSGFSADYFWVGGSGDYSQATTHWATTSGGSTFHSVAPTATDDVYFDANSFTAAGQSVTLNSSYYNYCRNMSWSGVTNNPGFTGYRFLIVSGDFELSPYMTQSGIRYEFDGSGSHSIDFSSHSAERFAIDGTGVYDLADSLIVDGYAYFNAGTLNSNNHNITINNAVNAYYTFNLNLGTSHFKIVSSSSSTSSYMLSISSNFTIDADSAIIELVNPPANPSTFYTNISSTQPVEVEKLIIHGQAYNFNLADNSTIDSLIIHSDIYAILRQDYKIEYLKSKGISFYGTDTIAKAEITGDFTTQENMVFDTLVLTESQNGHVYTIGYNRDLTVNDSISFPVGSCLNPHILKSYYGTSDFIKTNGYVTLDSFIVQSVNASGGASFISANTIDETNNTGWTFDTAFISDLYWIGGSGDWGNPTNWSTSSGGSPQSSQSCIPGALTNVHFDANSFSSSSDTIVLDPNVSCKNMDWTGATGNPVLDMVSSYTYLDIYGSLTSISTLTWHSNGRLNFSGTGTHTCDIKGNIVELDIYFQGSGSYTLLDSIHTTNYVVISDGTFQSDNHKINCKNFQTNYTYGGSPNTDLGTTTIELNSYGGTGSQCRFGYYGSIDVDSVEIFYNQTGFNNSFYAYTTFDFKTIRSINGLYNISLNSSSLDSLIIGSSGNSTRLTNNATIDYAYIEGDIAFNSTATVSKALFFDDVSFGNNITIDTMLCYVSNDSNTYLITANRTLTITDSIYFEPASCTHPHILASSAAYAIPGNMSVGNMSKSSGNVAIDGVILLGMQGLGSANFVATTVVESNNNNSGWTESGVSVSDLYWVGGKGNWSDPTNWATSSGGTPLTSADCTPLDSTNVHFDANSFSSANDTVFTTYDIRFNNMDWTGSTNTPTFFGNHDMEAMGSFELISGMNYTQSGGITFSSADSATIDFAGNKTAQLLSFTNDASYTLLDSIHTDTSFVFYEGKLFTHGHDIHCSRFIAKPNYGDTGELYLSTSKITVDGESSYNCVDVNAYVTVIDADSAEFYISGDVFNSIYIPTSNVKIKKIACNATSSNGTLQLNDAIVDTLIVLDNNGLTGDLQVYGIDSFKLFESHAYNITCNQNFYAEKCEIYGRASLRQKCYIDTLILSYDTFNAIQYGFPSDTCFVQDSIYVKRGLNDCNRIIINPAYYSSGILSNNANDVVLTYASLNNVHATGNVNTSIRNYTSSNSSGWNILPDLIDTLYWIGGTNSWSNANFWSSSSGGPTANCLPNENTTVIFDDNSFSAVNQSVYLGYSDYCHDFISIADTAFARFSGSNRRLQVYGSFYLDSSTYFDVDLYLHGKGSHAINMEGNRVYEDVRIYDGEYTLESDLEGYAFRCENTKLISKDYDLTFTSGTFGNSGNHSDSVILEFGKTTFNTTGNINFNNGTGYFQADLDSSIWNFNGSSNQITSVHQNLKIHKIDFESYYLAYISLPGSSIDTVYYQPSSGNYLTILKIDSIDYLLGTQDVRFSDTCYINEAVISASTTSNINSYPTFKKATIYENSYFLNKIEFDTLVFAGNDNSYSHSFPLGDSCIINDSFYIASTNCNNHSMYCTSGSTVLHFNSANNLNIDFIELTNVTASGSGTYNAGKNSLDIGGNSGWVFTGDTFELNERFIGKCISGTQLEEVKITPRSGNLNFWWRQSTSPYDTFNTNIDTVMCSSAVNYYLITEYQTNCFATDTIGITVAANANGTAQVFTDQGGDKDWFNCANWDNGYLPDYISKATIGSGDTAQITSDTAWCKDLIINGTLEVTGGVLMVFGDLSNFGEILQTGGQIHFTGSGNDSLLGDSRITVDSIVINKDGSYTIENSLEISGYANFEEGIMYANATDSVYFVNNASSNGGNDTSFIEGPVYRYGMPQFIYPIGKNGIWARLGISQVFTSADISTMKAEYFDAVPTDTASVNSPLVKVSGMEYWQLDRIKGSGSFRVRLFYEDSARSGIVDVSEARVAKYDGTDWNDLGVHNSSASNGAGFVTSNYVSSFSPFTFGTSDFVNYLPAEIVMIEAKWNHNDALLEWTTATEINNSHFDIERSEDGKNFIKIDEVKSKNPNSNSTLNYQFIDYTTGPLGDYIYYRLRQTDFDGKTTLSNIVVLEKEVVSDLVIYPNPSTGKVTIKADRLNGRLEVQNINGQTAFETTLDKRLKQYDVDLSHLPAGVYLIQVKNNLGLASQRIVIQ